MPARFGSTWTVDASGGPNSDIGDAFTPRSFGTMVQRARTDISTATRPWRTGRHIARLVATARSITGGLEILAAHTPYSGALTNWRACMRSVPRQRQKRRRHPGNDLERMVRSRPCWRGSPPCDGDKLFYSWQRGQAPRLNLDCRSGELGRSRAACRLPNERQAAAATAIPENVGSRAPRPTQHDCPPVNAKSS